MVSNAILDIAIGLMLVYLVLSLACTVVNEFIATFTKMRANNLQTAVEQLLDAPQLKADFYNHGLIDGTKAAINGSHPSYLSGQTFAMALLGSLDPTKPVPAFTDIEDAIKHLPANSNVRDILLAHVTTANGDLERLRDGVATWFDHAMDRVSGIYKKNIKLISLGVGFALALFVNADSITVAKQLWSDGSLRTQMVQNASRMVSTDPTKGTGSTDPVSVGQVSKAIGDAEKNLRPLPIGWDFSSDLAYGFNWNTLLKLAGLALTGLALSLGAPFWFDLLSKFMNIRGTGAKPSRTADSN